MYNIFEEFKNRLLRMTSYSYGGVFYHLILDFSFFIKQNSLLTFLLFSCYTITTS